MEYKIVAVNKTSTSTQPFTGTLHDAQRATRDLAAMMPVPARATLYLPEHYQAEDGQGGTIWYDLAIFGWYCTGKREYPMSEVEIDETNVLYLKARA